MGSVNLSFHLKKRFPMMTELFDSF